MGVRGRTGSGSGSGSGGGFIPADDRHREAVTCVRFFGNRVALLGDAQPDMIASSSRDETARLWRREDATGTWRTAATLSGHRGEVWCVGAVTGHVATGGSDWSVLVWDPESPDEPVARMDGHTRAVRSCDSHADAPDALATGSLDETVLVWDARAPEAPVARLETSSPVLCVRWGGPPFLCAGGGVAPDSMAGTRENVGGWLRVWDPRTWRVLGDASKALARPEDRLRPRASATGETDARRQAHDTAVSYTHLTLPTTPYV